jgi:hypothetical protein
MTNDETINLVFTANTSQVAAANQVLVTTKAAAQSAAQAMAPYVQAMSDATDALYEEAAAAERVVSATKTVVTGTKGAAAAFGEYAQVTAKGTQGATKAFADYASTTVSEVEKAANARVKAAQKAANTEATEADKAANAQERLARSTEASRNKMAGMGQTALQASRGLQDFQAAGLMGCINNIEGLAFALGGGAGLAGILTGVGVAALVAKPYLAKLFEGWAGKADDFRSELQKVKDDIKDLEKQPLTLQIKSQIESAKATEKAIEVRQAVVDAWKEQKDPEAVKSGKAFQDAMGGNATAVRSAVVADMQKQKSPELVANLAKAKKELIWAEHQDEGGNLGMTAHFKPKLDKAQAALDSQVEALGKQADILIQAATGGDVGAQREVVKRGGSILTPEQTKNAKEAGNMPEADRLKAAQIENDKRMAEVNREMGVDPQKQADDLAAGTKRVHEIADFHRGVAQASGRSAAARAQGELDRQDEMHQQGKDAGKIVADNTRRQVAVYAATEKAKAERFQDQAADASGLQDPITRGLWEARQRRLQFKSTGEARKFGRMSGIEQQRYASGKLNNDADDALAKKDASAYLMRNRFTKSKAEADKIADKMVNQARRNANSQTGDPVTDKVLAGQEKVAEGLESLREQMAKGVYVNMR